jgi:hypothetical protein
MLVLVCHSHGQYQYGCDAINYSEAENQANQCSTVTEPGKEYTYMERFSRKMENSYF